MCECIKIRRQKSITGFKVNSREATSQADMLACPFSDCRGVKYPAPPWGGIARKKLGHAP